MEFNSAIFSAMLVKWGAVPKTYPIVPDQPELVEAAVRRAAEECDMVLLNAGSSAGREDYSAAAIHRFVVNTFLVTHKVGITLFITLQSHIKRCFIRVG